MLAERCSANDAAEWQNVLALPQNEKQQSIGKAALAELYRPRINDTQKSACAKRQNAAVHWQNVVALAAERNTTIKWESAGARLERCSANDATEDWQNVFSAAAEQMGKSGGATAERRMQYEMCAELIH